MSGGVRHIRFSILGVFTIVVTAGGVVAETPFWPQFHGPNRDNISNESGLLRAWPAGGPDLVWTAKGLGHGYSSLAIADGRIARSSRSDRFSPTIRRRVKSGRQRVFGAARRSPMAPDGTGPAPPARSMSSMRRLTRLP